jgi:deazaflavin-dependent oxidoreductase (nitroreductase family)
MASSPPPPRPRIAGMRRFTVRFVNPFTRQFVHRLPGFCLLIYKGRKTNQTYRIPMNVFHRQGHYIFALTYGHDVQWVKNVLASGEADIRIGDRVIHLVDPEPFTDPTRSLMPLPARILLGVFRVHGFLRMRPAQPGEPAPLPGRKEE